MEIQSNKNTICITCMEDQSMLKSWSIFEANMHVEDLIHIYANNQVYVMINIINKYIWFAGINII